MSDFPSLSDGDNAQEPQTFTIRANGVDRQLTVDELKTWASKAIGAEEKFRAAAEKEATAKQQLEEVQQARQWQSDLQAAQSGDLDAFRRVAKSWGASDEEVATMVQQYQTAGQGSQAQAGPALPPRQLAVLQRMERMLAEFDKRGLDPVKTLAEGAEFQNLELTDRSKAEVRKLLDKDPVYRRLLKKDASGTIFDDVYGNVHRRVRSGAAFSPETIQEAAKEVRTRLDVLSQVLTDNASGVHPGSFGAAPVSDAGISRLQPPQPPNLADYNKKGDLAGYIEARLRYEQYQAAQDSENSE